MGGSRASMASPVIRSSVCSFLLSLSCSLFLTLSFSPSLLFLSCSLFLALSFLLSVSCSLFLALTFSLSLNISRKHAFIFLRLCPFLSLFLYFYQASLFPSTCPLSLSADLCVRRID